MLSVILVGFPTSFNSRTREGCDRLDEVSKETGEFQFTHPRGVRCVPKLTSSNIGSFNSRTREGCDINITKKINNFQVSIHAPARGAIPLVSMVLLSF